MKAIAIASLLALTALNGAAQPAARRSQQKAQQPTSAKTTLTTRAQISFPTAQQLKEDVVWRRDIYREIDLTKGENSGLYYPVEPVGSPVSYTHLTLPTICSV